MHAHGARPLSKPGLATMLVPAGVVVVGVLGRVGVASTDSIRGSASLKAKFQQLKLWPPSQP